MDMCVQKAREALALAPEFTEAHYTLGTAHQKLDCTVEAEAAFRAALALKPDYVEALNSLGTVLQ
ncbi:tetratricopeptide repeat protein, partial [Acinetobacter baumannii]